MAHSQSVTTLEESVINYARLNSLQTQRKDSSYTFKTIAIPIKTKYNDARITLEEKDCITDQQWFYFLCTITDEFDGKKQLTNTCIFHSICDGLLNHGITHVVRGTVLYPATPFNLILLSGFDYPHEMLDTFNPNHVKCLETLLKLIPEVQLHFYIGMKKDNDWFAAPDSPSKFGRGTTIIKILNKGQHFEFILNPDTDFIRPPRTMTPKKAFVQQHSILKKSQQIKDDWKFAHHVASKELEEYEEKKKKVEHDYKLALKLNNDY